jgi:hypothetical protein
MNNRLERIWNEGAQHLPKGTTENHKTLNQNSQSLGRDLNPAPAEYEAGMLTT